MFKTKHPFMFGFFIFLIISVNGCGQKILVDCGQNETCFLKQLSSCSKAKFTTPELDFLGTKVEYFYRIEGMEENHCKVISKFIQNPNPDLIGKEMICKIPKDDLGLISSDITDYSTYLTEKLFEICSGPLIDSINLTVPDEKLPGIGKIHVHIKTDEGEANYTY